MGTEAIEAVFLETRNWGKAAKFFQALGYEMEMSAGDGSGVFRNGEGPYLVVVEIPEDREPGVQIALKVPDADAFRADPAIDVVTPFQDTHYGTREMTVRDPDGRLWSLQAPTKS
ncbi:VOC family protein [Spirillospora sp. NBC_01491]|uniref:VOC family protein n=1 Tax=Spirillospora sp. NBC_01491 TaxID=2976007 RepID=UPI002E2ECB2F|nr:VOC family protein [Spirillospora sp. NBC_01491]